MTVSVVFILDIGGNYWLYQIYLFISLFSWNPILAFVEAVFFHDGAASNQRLTAPKAEKNLTIAKSRNSNLFIHSG